MIDPENGGQAAGRPMGRVFRFLLRRHRNNCRPELGLLCGIFAAMIRPARQVLLDASEASRREAISPPSYLIHIHLELSRNAVIGDSGGGQ